ncbi:UDP-N-acetylmuramoyl-L-alanyl-D-glutamate--2,6-diaminopimelate ligase [Sporosarcina cyprini]|uniref:UDP-N-acetylmuramoyl-L-alanyl-D-glutamate--2, 6-diaminopimelate ligase n=1 Tax=Sporosarcina cyprini TaxID=2910523 RepID=UPI00300D7256
MSIQICSGKGRGLLLLSELLKDWPCQVLGGIHTKVKGVTEHSTRISEGYLFVARKGGKTDGICYVEEAIEKGACGIVIDRNAAMEIRDQMSIPLIIVPDCRKFISYASARLEGNPSELLTIVAVTGTNGKTTVTHFASQLLQMANVKTAVIGTTGIFIDGHQTVTSYPEMTTLPPEHFHQLLKDLVDAGVTHVLLEASSMGLATSRLAHCNIDIGVFLNIGIDHYEEHGGKQQYLDSKKILAYQAKTLIANSEDELCKQMVADAKVPVHYFDYGTICGEQIDEELIRLQLPGRHNRMNAMAALSVLRILGYELADILPLSQSLQLPEGRLQSLQQDGITVYVDYAHTPDALENVLQALAGECSGNLITVFGCGGDRDHGKRPKMGEVASTYSTKVIITSDNPRSENPSQIIEEILLGIRMKENVHVQVDRRTAIYEAIALAKTGDVVLIAGKGHEKTQYTKEGVFPFSDYEVAAEAFQNR